eukprot:2611395-Amphidinium_carterae.3
MSLDKEYQAAVEKKLSVNGYDIVAEAGTAVEVVVMRMLDNTWGLNPSDFGKPWLWAKDAFNKAVDQLPATEVEKQVNSLVQQATPEINKGVRVRTVENVPANIAEALVPLMTELTPLLINDRPPVPDLLKPYLLPQTFVTGPTSVGSPFCQACFMLHTGCSMFHLAENAHLPTIRWHSIRSTAKRILVTRESALLAFMHAKSAAGPAGVPVAFSALWGFFRRVCTDTSPLPEWSMNCIFGKQPIHLLFAQYMAQHGNQAVWYGVVQPGDALYTPASCVVLEYLAGTALGYKWHIVPPGVETAQQLSGIAAHMQALATAGGKTPSSLEVVKCAKSFAEDFHNHLVAKACKTLMSNHQ